MNKKYDIIFTNKFKKNYTKMKQQANFKNEEFERVIEILSNNELLPAKYSNHLLNPKSKRYMGMSHTTWCATRI